MRLMYIDCPYCGQDNLLPPEVVQARQRQYELDQRHYALQLQEQERQRVFQERERQRRQRTGRLVIGLAVAGFFVLLLFGSCMAIGVYANREEAEAKARAQDPKVNGQAALLARLAELRQKQGCSRILVQPATRWKEVSTISLDMIKNDACVHILATTGAETLTFAYADGSSSVSIELAAGATRQQIADAINAKTSGPVVAAVVKNASGTEQLVLSARKTGKSASKSRRTAGTKSRTGRASAGKVRKAKTSARKSAKTGAKKSVTAKKAKGGSAKSRRR